MTLQGVATGYLIAMLLLTSLTLYIMKVVRQSDQEDAKKTLARIDTLAAQGGLTATQAIILLSPLIPPLYATIIFEIIRDGIKSFLKRQK